MSSMRVQRLHQFFHSIHEKSSELEGHFNGPDELRPFSFHLSTALSIGFPVCLLRHMSN